jgi:hypothetical protein
MTSSPWRAKFHDLAKQSIDEQARVFEHRFVFSLGDRYKEVQDLKLKFLDALKHDDGKDSLSPAAAAGFLQSLGRTRTAMQRNAELKDVDMDGDGRTSFIEYLLLHFKIMILEEFFKRKSMAPDVEMGNDGVGLTGVGDRLIEELFAVPAGLDPELEKLMEEFSIQHKKREDEIKELEALIAEGGVKGMAAKTKLTSLQQEDQTAMHAVEAKIAAAIKKARKKAEEEVKKKHNEEDSKKKEEEEHRKMGLGARKAGFEH